MLFPILFPYTTPYTTGLCCSVGLERFTAVAGPQAQFLLEGRLCWIRADGYRVDLKMYEIHIQNFHLYLNPLTCYYEVISRHLYLRST
jgi:hypothetical protein